MAKENIVFVCENCGAESNRWSGKCSVCGEWNSMVEIRRQAEGKRSYNSGEFGKPLKLKEIKSDGFGHMATGVGELDRVLGGGFVPGALILLAGDPGIGKSTLVLELANRIKNVLYISGEESVEQIKLRAQRLKIKDETLELLGETNVSYIIKITLERKPKLVIIDSIQTMWDENFPSTPGSIVQVRGCALRLQKAAKGYHIPIILIGHATKEGAVAGPRTLEHLVDVVLWLEGDRFHETRILRGVKNRYGATDEIGLFKMTSAGLTEIANPSALFLEERRASAGSIVTATIEGTRPMLLEVQALTTPTVFGYPKRTGSGFDVNRLQLLLAVLTNRLRLPLQNYDVYINVTGGFQIKEPACDLAVAAAVISAIKNKPLDEKYCVFGEVGLAGEIRRVPQVEKRKKEAQRLGYNRFLDIKSLYEIMKMLE